MHSFALNLFLVDTSRGMANWMDNSRCVVPLEWENKGVWCFSEHYKRIYFMLASSTHCPVSIHDSWLRKTFSSPFFRVLWLTALGQARSVLEYVTSIFVLRLTTLQWSYSAGFGQPCRILCSGFVQDLLKCFSQSLFSSLPEVLCFVKHN